MGSMETTSLRPPKGTMIRFRRQPRHVRPHAASGGWTICIGKQRARDGSRLRPKDWYFQGTEADANAEAERIQAKWAFVCAHWDRLYRSRLELLADPFASVPHWQPS